MMAIQEILILFRMEGEKDVLLQYFSEEHASTLQKYAQRLPLQAFREQNPKDLKAHYTFLNETDPSQQTPNNLMPKLLNIRGDRMPSVLNNQIYAIFCQVPAQWNSRYFWSTCYTEKVAKIFMLCGEEYRYWPKVSQELKFQQQNLTVRCLLEEPVGSVLVRRPIVIAGPDGEHRLEHLHFTKWRDGGVPRGEEQEKAFAIMVEEAIQHIENSQMIVVHCMAGVGRTGTFGAVVEAVRSFRSHKAASLFEIVKNMRLHREYCVETLEQYCFAHKQAQLLP